VITRQPPAVGSAVAAGDVIAGVNGRPMFVLDGTVPAFRQMGPGMEGDDIGQLQRALDRLGFPVNDRSGTYGPGTAAAVTRLYESVGYEPAGPTPDQLQALATAGGAVSQARAAQQEAANAVEQASQPPSPSSVEIARLGVSSAQHRLDLAIAAGEDSSAAKAQLLQAQAALDLLTAAPDVSKPRAALQAADAALADAQRRFEELQSNTGTSVPYCEVIFVPELPGVTKRISSTASGSVGSQGGPMAGSPSAWIQIATGDLVGVASVSDADHELLEVDGAATIGSVASPARATIASIEADPTEGSRWRVVVRPEVPFAADQLGDDLRIAFSVGSTSGDVLVVPLAAVSARADGSTHVTKVDDSGLADVTVDAGLSADGFVEVTPAPLQLLRPGDRVRVGQ
jgi:peptidoglycan hydrolase-like protein with peptidoglycan-binding domain